MSTIIEIELNEINNEIHLWNEYLKERDDVIELAFFKIFVKFEKFLVDIFVKYSTGVTSSQGYIPIRKLEFVDEKHLIEVTMPSNKDYLELNDRFISLVENVLDTSNPISLFFSSADRYFYDKLRYMRNYIAHESSSSYNKYIKHTLNNGEYISPKEFLLKKKSKTNPKTNYSAFIEMVQLYSKKILTN
ncbi:MAG: hypothetical protein RBR50_06190 [Candidatus Izemoplasmatales bacterium]|jgi:hypothetical protein|nr:hypothetical protein [Candidatus Izemoplasmatales bacterium]